MLREYLTEMTEIVFRHGGAVDKYIGDCVMALYSVPLEDPEHAVKAVRTALEFQERTLAVSRRWEEKLGIAIRNGVGINTGEAVVGTLGSRQLFQYTAIGDTINLGARLESITKDYKTNIIISEFTYALVKDQFVTKELGDVTVKGKSQPVKIYAVLPDNIRKHPRAALEAAAVLSIAGEGRACSVLTLDISERGMALKGVPEDWVKGQTVQIRCEGGALPKPIVAEATITWRKGDEVGVTFTSLDPEWAPTVAGLDLLKPLITAAAKGDDYHGIVVIGTAQGDLHDIGKNLVAMMLEGAGFKVVNLGRDVAPEKFVAAVEEHNANIVGISALMTTTMPGMKRTIDALIKAGLRERVKVMVGGAPVAH